MEEWEKFLAKAEENLRACQSASKRKGLCNAAANRAYYAAYLAELAALQKIEPVSLPKTGWKHANVVKAFNHRLIKRKRIFSASIIEKVGILEGLRIKADYRAESVTGQEAQKCFTLASEIVNVIRKELRKKVK